MATFNRVVLSWWMVWFILAIPVLHILPIGLVHKHHTEAASISADVSVYLLALALGLTPLRFLTKNAAWVRFLIKHRRAIGVAAFSYAALHVVFIYLTLENPMQEIFKALGNVGIITGIVGLVLLAVPAVLSNDYSVRLLRKSWKPMQRLVYPAALVTMLHMVFFAETYSLAFDAIAVLLALEVYRMWRQRETIAQSLSAHFPRSSRKVLASKQAIKGVPLYQRNFAAAGYDPIR